ncbi:MAG: hypothetical protein ACYTFQ_27290 [Planctomycetota bacterium]|jgi:hypothetical protein
MPDDFEDTLESQGTVSDDIAPSTASGDADQDLLSGTDDAQSDDLGVKPPADDGEDSHSGTEVIDESDLTLLRYEPEQGIDKIRDKIERFVKNQNKAFTRRMSKLAKESTPMKQKATQFDALDRAVAIIGQHDPEYVKGLRKRLDAAVKGEYSSWGSSGNPKPSKKIESVPDLLGEVKSMIREELGSVRGEYVRDKASDRVNAVLAKTKNERLHGHRDAMIATLSANPDWDMKRVLGSIDPELLVQLSGSRKAASPSSQEQSDFTTPIRRAYKTIDDAFDGAVAKHGDPELRPPAH